MRLAAHQNNFIPWLKYFHKMAKADVFVLMSHCQFEKNGYTNRCKVNGKWWTKPVNGGMDNINAKLYVDGQSLHRVNKLWIYAIASTLSIDTTKIKPDFPTAKKGTERIIELCERYQCNEYLTNPNAIDKYLDEAMMRKAGIKIIPHTFEYTGHVFEAFDQFGVEGTTNLINR